MEGQHVVAIPNLDLNFEGLVRLGNRLKDEDGARRLPVVEVAWHLGNIGQGLVVFDAIWNRARFMHMINWMYHSVMLLLVRSRL